MKIVSSNVSMASSRKYESHYSAISSSLVTTADKAATLEFSDESKTLMEQMEENRRMLSEEERKAQEERNKQSNQNLWDMMFNRNNKVSDAEFVPEGKSEGEIQLEILKRILLGLRGIKNGKFADNMNRLDTMRKQYAMSSKYSLKEGSISVGGTNTGVNALSSGGGTKWTKTVVTSAFFGESEKTAFQSTGVVRTADGREINFGVTLEMSRSFCQTYESISQSSYILTDPLVINLDTNIGSVTEQKFLFDIDSDGDKEEVSFAGEGSGFLAIDKNRDGEINDGNELFGTQSGNGFKDLAEYDKDGNGWIDEGDAVFKDLKIWVKDENGDDKLIDLKKAGVGAIYLDNASTHFSLNRMENNQTDGVIQSTGIYLKENGDVGTIQHIDLAT